MTSLPIDFSVKIPEELRELIRRVGVDWSEYLREAIKSKGEGLAKEASEKLDEIREKAEKVPTDTLVKWIREEREGAKVAKVISLGEIGSKL